MHKGNGHILEVILADGFHYARISCPENLIPAPGQYLLASDSSDSPLAIPIFYTDFAAQGFMTCIPRQWIPGQSLYLKGPLGRGFTLPVGARKVGLITFDGSPAFLRGLIRPSLVQNASVVLVSDRYMDELPDEVEVQPFSVLEEILEWADYIAMDVNRENLPGFRERLGKQNHLLAVRDAQVLIRTNMPCGGVAECGVCAVVTRSGWQMACKEGPVFDWREI